MVIDHIGIVVQSMERAIESWKSAYGYEQMTEPVVNTRQKVRVVFLRKEGSLTVKLVEPLDATSSIASLSARGGGLHHLCFTTADMENTMRHLVSVGAKVPVPPEPGEAFENEPIAFLFLQGIRIELIETARRARLLATKKPPEG
jgi:methylmalonyl-CoA/ethylmalonyl-CoA epimerase